MHDYIKHYQKDIFFAFLLFISTYFSLFIGYSFRVREDALRFKPPIVSDSRSIMLPLGETWVKYNCKLKE